MPSDKQEAQRSIIEQYIRQLADGGRVATALGEAARWGRLDLVKELLATGLHVDERTESGVTPLLLAASGGQREVVRYLLERGADVHAVGGPTGMTPLIACLAARQQKRTCLTICRLLLEAGASGSLGTRDGNGRTALDWAKDGRPAEIVALLKEIARG